MSQEFDDNYFECSDEHDPFDDSEEDLEEEGMTLLIYPILRETEKAYLVRLRKDNKEHWFPKSQVIHIDDECIHITDWIAEQKDI